MSATVSSVGESVVNNSAQTYFEVKGLQAYYGDS